MNVVKTVVARLLQEDEELPMTVDEVTKVLDAIDVEDAGHDLSFVSVLNKFTDREMIRPDAAWVRDTFDGVRAMVTRSASQDTLWRIYDAFSRWAH